MVVDYSDDPKRFRLSSSNQQIFFQKDNKSAL